MQDTFNKLTPDQLRDEITRLHNEAAVLSKRVADAEQQADQLRILAAKLTHMENQERRRLSLLLHDQLQQLLVGSRMKLGLLKQQNQTPPFSSALQETASLIDQAIAMSRSLCAELSPPILYEAGLGAGMQWLAEQMQNKHGLQIEFEVDDEPEDRDIGVFLFQCIRELMFNVVKHAKINSARVVICPLDENSIQIKVSDDGVGFSPTVLKQCQNEESAFSLHNISERLALLGGKMEVATELGKGVTVTLVAPLRSLHKHNDE